MRTKKQYVLLFNWLLFSSFVCAQSFNATPLTDFEAQSYFGFAGYLYEDSNLMASDHDADGYAAGLSVEALDTLGHPSSTGKIGIISVGHSIPEREWCGDQVNHGVCYLGSMMSVMAGSVLVNPAVAAFNCAQEGASTFSWAYPGASVFPRCKSLLATKGMTPAQVQIIWWDGVENQPQARDLQSMSLGMTCIAVADPIHAPSGNDICVHRQLAGIILRLFKKNYPNLKQVFITAGAYAGYFPRNCAVGQFLCPDNEPFMYEIGFGKKQLIENQIQQMRDGTIDVVAGDISYQKTAWIGWGPYLWAPACSLGTRADGLCYNRADFAGDGLHPSVSGVGKIVEQQLMPFFLNDPHTRMWFAQ